MTERRSKRWKAAGSIFIIVIVSTILFLFGKFIIGIMAAQNIYSEWENWSIDQEPWEKLEFEAPDVEATFIFYRQHAHPFLAEYNRKIEVVFPDKDSLMFDLPMNTGGLTKINFYQYSTNSSSGQQVLNHFVLIDRLGRYPIFFDDDFSLNGEDYVLLEEIYLGRIDGRSGELVFVTAEEDEEEKIK